MGSTSDPILLDPTADSGSGIFPLEFVVLAPMAFRFSNHAVESGQFAINCQRLCIH